MAAVLGRTEVGVREIGTTVTVPNNPKARLMYYLSCLCSVLDLSDTDNLSKLRDFRKHYLLTEEEADGLAALCIILSPDVLLGKVIFQDAAMCGDSTNKFYEISAVRHNLLVSDSVIIGGQRRAVSKIMFCTHQWLLTNWIEPMKHFAPRLARIVAGSPASGSRAQPARAIEYGRQPQSNSSNRQPQTSYRQPQTSYRQPQNTSSDNGCCCVIL